MRLAFIVPRYGPEILGGPEYQCRLIAERLAARHQVDVLTTCARDPMTWANAHPEGADRLRGVTVRRFVTARTRDPIAVTRSADLIFFGRHQRQDETEWLRQQGPWTPALIEYLERQHAQYDVLVFFTCMHAPAVLGIRVAPYKSVLVPMVQDEPALQLGLYAEVFGSAAALAWNTDDERRLVTSRFHLRSFAEEVVGCGVDLPEGETSFEGGERRVVGPPDREPLAPHLEGPANTFRRRHRMYGPFVLSAGRVEPGKGCEELLEYFQHYLHEGGDARLMLMGSKLMPLLEDPGVRFAGTLPDEDRLHSLEAATVVVVPSPDDNQVLLALEAFSVGTPVLANARATTVVQHCRRSQAGLFYADRWEFTEALKLLGRDAGLRSAMGRNGKAYVSGHYRWDTVLAKYERLFDQLRTPGRDARVEPSETRDLEQAAAGPRPRGREPERNRDRARPRDRDRQRHDRSRHRGREQRPRR